MNGNMRGIVGKRMGWYRGRNLEVCGGDVKGIGGGRK